MVVVVVKKRRKGFNKVKRSRRNSSPVSFCEGIILSKPFSFFGDAWAHPAENKTKIRKGKGKQNKLR